MAKSKDKAEKPAEQPQAQVQTAEQAVSEDIAQDRKPTPEEAKAMLEGADRVHEEGLGMPWGVLLGAMPGQLMPQVIGTVLHDGGTRPAWKWTVKGTDFILMAWPKDQPVRASVVMAGPENEKMKPIDAAPLLEGLPNDFAVSEVHAWQSGIGGNVAVTMEEGRNPMWFYDPLFERDLDDLTPGVQSTFNVAGLAFSVRKALLDEISITRGPLFEAHAEDWLAKNEGKSRLDVPPLKIPLAGRRLIMPGRQFCEYQMRATIERVEDCQLEKMPIKILYVTFPFENRAPLVLPIYAPKSVLKDYEPEAGQEIDAYVWLQGRIIDMDTVPSADMPVEHRNPLKQ